MRKMSRLAENDHVKYLGCVCIVLVFLALMKAVLQGPVSYEVKICVNDCEGLSPEIYLVENDWWGFARDEYPMRYRSNDGLADWQYMTDGRWRSLLYTDAGYQIDIYSGEYMTDDYE